MGPVFTSSNQFVKLKGVSVEVREVRSVRKVASDLRVLQNWIKKLHQLSNLAVWGSMGTCFTSSVRFVELKGVRL